MYYEAERSNHINCSYRNCPNNAIVSYATTGQLCREHYDNHWQSEALKYTHKMGLDTPEKRMAYVKNYIRVIISGVKMEVSNDK
jgi:hypothetical protein